VRKDRVGWEELRKVRVEKRENCEIEREEWSKRED